MLLKKVFLLLFTINLIGLFFLFFPFIAQATISTTFTATCSRNPFAWSQPCNNFSDAIIPITTATVDVILDVNTFDDQGELSITKPDGTVITLVTANAGPGNWNIKSLPSGSMFNSFDLLGNYTIHVWAKDVGGGVGTAASATFKIITNIAPTCSLIANPSNISSGENTTLNWTTTYVSIPPDSATISNNKDSSTITAANTPGNKIVTPVSDIVYTMTVNNGMTATCTAQVTVAPPSCTLNANPGKVYSGQPTKLNWQITGAAATANASIDKGIGAVASPAGNANTPAITGATLFTLTFTGIDTLSHSCSVTVNIFTPTVITFEKKTSISSANELIAAIINWLLRMASSLVIFFLVIGGIYYITATGDAEKIKEGKKIITYVIIGLIVVLISYTLVTTLNKIIFG